MLSIVVVLLLYNLASSSAIILRKLEEIELINGFTGIGVNCLMFEEIIYIASFHIIVCIGSSAGILVFSPYIFNAWVLSTSAIFSPHTLQ